MKKLNEGELEDLHSVCSQSQAGNYATWAVHVI